MRIKAIVDEKSKNYPSVVGCLEALKEQIGIPIFYDIIYRDLSYLSWVQYNGINSVDMGVSFEQIQKETKIIWDNYEYQYDTIIYFIDESNWHANKLRPPTTPQIKGWNLGQFFNNYQIQLLATNDNISNMNYRLFEEVAHSIDDFAYRELGRNLDAELGLDYDEDIVHDRNNPNGVRGDYKEFYAANKSLIELIITTRQKKAIYSLMSKVVILMRDLLMKLLNKPRPTIEYNHG